MRKQLVLFSITLLATGLWGCGSLDDGSTPPSGPSQASLESAATVGADSCVLCHVSATPLKASEWLGGMHANGTLVPQLTDPTYNATCDPCHNPLGDGLKLNTNVTGQVNRPVVGCESCHGGGELHLGNRAIAFPRSSQAKCIVCHPLTTDAVHVAFPATVADNYSITDTHVDDPLTATTASGTTVEGYVVKVGSTGCNDCHNAHTADTTINQQWARSAHGGHILVEKEAGNPGATDDSGIAWTHYDWDKSYKVDGTDTDTNPDKDRVDCQRCHTATGVANFMNGPTAYDPNKNDFSHLAEWQWTWANAPANTIPGVTTSSGQNELLYCWGCHSDASSGALRDPGALSFTGNLAYTNGATATFPDVAGSNICISCHSGRETGDSLKLDPSDGVNRSFINSHYLSGGGTVFRTTGYEFGNLNYSDLTWYKHKQIGVTEAGTGSNGPCVGCHMSRPESHLFLPVTRNLDGTIASVDTDICVTCHFGTVMEDLLNTAKNGYLQAQDVLAAALAAKGILFAGDTYPYFFIDNNPTNGVLDPAEAVSTNGYKNWAAVYPAQDWHDAMGAAFNLNLLAHDHGGYVHNRIYVKRLLFDSIDFIDNGVLDGVITIDEGPYADAAVWFTADAATNIATRP